MTMLGGIAHHNETMLIYKLKRSVQIDWKLFIYYGVNKCGGKTTEYNKIRRFRIQMMHKRIKHDFSCSKTGQEAVSAII